jgi:hypothetical protein
MKLLTELNDLIFSLEQLYENAWLTKCALLLHSSAAHVLSHLLLQHSDGSRKLTNFTNSTNQQRAPMGPQHHHH